MNRKQNTTPPSTIPIYRDQRLNDLPGEKWEDIPGIDGYFLVSTLGRIKRQEREVVYPNGRVHMFKEKIILPRVAKTFNKHTQDYLYGLHAHLRVEGRKYHLPIRRLVYHCFVKPFALDDPSVCIVTKMGNGLDIRPGNLEMIDTTAKMQRIYDRRRMVSIFRLESYRQQGVAASVAVTGRQVSQYDKKGRRIKTFTSISAAARAVGLTSGQISHVVHEIEPTAGGFFWRSGKAKTFDVKAFIARRRQGYVEKKGTKVTQYDAQGNPLAHYASLQAAGKAIKGHWTSISAVIRGRNKTAYGYRWKKGYHTRKIKSLPTGKTKR